MRQLINRMVIAGLILSLVGGLVAACAKPSVPPTTTPTPSQVPTSTAKPAAPLTTTPTPSPTPAPATKPIELKLWSQDPFSHATSVILRQFLAEVEKASAGRLVVKLYYSGELPFKPVDSLKAAQQGVADMVYVSAASLSGDVPELALTELPFIAPIPKDQENIVYPMLRPWWDRVLGKFNARLLLSYAYGPAKIFSNKPTKSVADLKGQKIRVFNPEIAEMGRIMGFNPVSISISEVDIALQQGTVDGLVTAALTVWTRKMYETMKYGLMLPTAYGNNLIFVNKNAWDRMPKDLQDVVQKALVNADTASWGLFKTVEMGEAYQGLLQKGMVMTDVPQTEVDELKKKMSPVWDSWAKRAGPEAPQMLRDVLSALGK